ncbi:MAG TPA: sugar phosphate nucleotidyltransferase [Gemmatimonadaceae bacterium]|nr:sugar phosphate nucleotidyltransferase [Gemmatimonadaceae bacterium]
MLAVILAGGKGTRLKPFTMTIPKPLLPLGDVPVLEIVLRQLAADGFTKIILTIGHMSPLFLANFGDGRELGLSITYVRESEPLGTAAPLRQLENLPEDFLVMNGDLLTDLSYRDLFKAHRSAGAAATMAVIERKERIDYGLIQIGEDGSFRDYEEKPLVSHHVSMGINVLNKRVLTRVPAAGHFDMPELILALHRGGEKVHCHRADCYWQDIGRFDDYTRASEDFVRDSARFLRPATQAGK